MGRNYVEYFNAKVTGIKENEKRVTDVMFTMPRNSEEANALIKDLKRKSRDEADYTVYQILNQEDSIYIEIEESELKIGMSLENKEKTQAQVFVSTVKFNGYRTAMTRNNMIVIDRNSETGKAIEKSLAEAAGNSDDKSVFELTKNGKTLYFMMWDWEITIGTAVEYGRF